MRTATLLAALCAVCVQADVVVESVIVGSLAEKAGIRVGDVLVSYDAHPLHTPCSLQAWEENTFDKKDVEVKTSRGVVKVPLGPLGIGCRPELADKAREMYKEALVSKEPAFLYEKAAEVEGKSEGGGWLLVEASKEWHEAGKDDAAQKCAKSAILLFRERNDDCGESLARGALDDSLLDPSAEKEQNLRDRLALDGGGKTPLWEAKTYIELGRLAWLRGDLAAADELLKKALAIRERRAPDSMDLAASYNNLGLVARQRGDLAAAEDLYKKALAIRERKAPDSLDLAASYNNLGIVAWKRGDLAVADELLKKALAIRERRAPDSMDLAASYNNLGLVAYNRGDLAAEEDLYRKALAIEERKAPDSLDLAAIYNNLATVAWKRGDLAVAEELYKKALAIRDQKAPDSLDLAASYNGLGIVARDRGDLAVAQELHTKALAIRERRAPDSLDLAASYNNLGIVAAERGDLAMAEEVHKKALAILERKAPDNLELARSYYNLGILARKRGDLAAAEDLYKKALAIRERKAPNSLDLAASYNSLGIVARERGDLAVADELLKKALAIREREAPDSLDLAQSYNSLGLLARKRGDLAAADLHKKALAIQERKATGSLDLAISYICLGIVAADRGELAAAEDLYRKALAIQERKAPDSLNLAVSYENLGAVAYSRGDLAAAEGLYRKAAAVVDQQRAVIWSPEGKGLFAERKTTSLSGLVLVEARLSKPADAFTALERLVGRGVAEQMAERAVEWTKGAPPELLKEQDNLLNEMNIARTGLNKEGDDESKANAWREMITALGVKQRDLDERFRKETPKYASIKMPKPLDLAGAQSALDHGTLLLSFFISNKECYLFAITRGDIQMYELGKDGKAITELVDTYVLHLSAPQDVTQEGKELYDLLLRPAQKEIDSAKRLLIAPSAVLNRLPFSALVVEAKPQERGVAAVSDGKPKFTMVTYLGDYRPLHQTISMTVYAEMLKLRERGGGGEGLLALADPVYDIYTEESKERAAQRGMSLERLPATKYEAQAIAKALGAGGALLGFNATETALKAEGAKSKYVHLACHGLLGGSDPLNASLALTKDDKNDGFLTAYEIMQMELAADLVTLSACQTALGEVTQTEGVVGLTRSFLFAGARTVVSSLWKVQDDPTACLMVHFYQNLKSGMTKDMALRQAMKTTRETTEWNGKRRDWSHPKYWAAFTLTGDWR